jgi:short subunit dehydrogenase-like uncharacterized protein
VAVGKGEHDAPNPTTARDRIGSVSDAWLLYGATGYTGRLILAEALALGLRPILGGRDERRLATLAASHGLRYRVAALDDPGGLAASLDGIRVVLHAAGPFSTTSRPMVDACLHAGAHYLDITGEVLVLEAIAGRHAEAVRRGVMLMPAVGFDVVPSDCLAAHVARRLPHARRLALGISGLTLATRGSARTFVELPASSPRVRRDGVLVSVTPGTHERRFDYGDGARPSTCVSWGDLTTAHYTTGIPDIEVYFETTPALSAGMASARAFGWLLATPPWQAFLKASTAFVPEGPTAAERAATSMTIVAEAEDADGRRVGARLRTPQAYTFTGASAAAVARRVLGDDVEPGFQTPGRHFGPDFVLGLPGVTRQDLDQRP